ncbi:MAG: hypothetical protein CL885_04550 [Dehalococcoidia bacterium]|nr:hypothetical protein [Dehalococcoidia bacterium]|tara:strand:- start:359 stop:538 length:180 start_codon:yes stop_codon:yes gene_type:complete
MKVGDLIMFQNCAQQGKTGIIQKLTKPSCVSKENPALQLYWVLCDTGVQCFTGNQLVVV